MYWIPLVLLLGHMVEELPRFPEWASRQALSHRDDTGLSGILTGPRHGNPAFSSATVYVFNRTFVERLLTSSQVVSAVVIGTIAGGAAVASLWLRMDLDWRFRRPAPRSMRL